MGPAVAARAATVTAVSSWGGEKAQYPVTTTLTVTGSDGPDDLRVSRDDHAFEVVDELRPVTAGRGAAGCAAIDEHHLRCGDQSSSLEATVLGGGGDDRLTVDGASADGGPGDDVVTAVGRGGNLAGGPGVDVVTGSDGDDTFTYHVGDVSPGEVADGGAGIDTVAFEGATAPVTVDLATQTANWAGVRLTLKSIEDASADGPATLVGDDGPNVLGVSGHGTVDGRGGDDRIVDAAASPPAKGAPASTLRGGAGDDVIVVGPGDVVDAGPGGDRVLRRYFGAGVPDLGYGGPAGLIACGDGFDALDLSFSQPRPSDCELTSLFHVGGVGPLAVRAGALQLTVNANLDGCGSTLRAVSPAGRPLATPIRTTHRRGLVTLRLPLSALGRALLVRAKPVPVTLVFRTARVCGAAGRWRNVVEERVVTAVR